jgi:hypothetical protein
MNQNQDREKKKLGKSDSIESYDEEINYNIKNNKTGEDKLYSTYFRMNNSNNKTNSINKDYWIEEKNRYIQRLEKKIKFQENKINKLLFKKNNSKIENSINKEKKRKN